MEDTIKTIETLLERAAEYGITNFELIKLKMLDKISREVSSFLSHTIVFVIIGSFTLFLNLGAALWIGELMGKMYFGFFIVAAFYAVLAMTIHFFMRKWFKRMLNDAIIRFFSDKNY